MAVSNPLQLLDVERSVLFLSHVIEETDALFSERRWASDSSGAVRECLLANTPRRTHVETIVLAPALTALPRENLGFRFSCACPAPFPAKTGHSLADREPALLNRFPDL
jgi:hypothetical protein